MRLPPRLRVAGSLPARLTFFCLAAGALIRVLPYLANRSLWLDEASLALNIVSRSWGGLLRPLDHTQAAPIGFLMLEKAAVQLLGPSEYALRLLPLLAGLASLLLFARVARRCLDERAVPIAVALFALCEPLVYYSCEAKPYALDVALALLLLDRALDARDDPGRAAPVVGLAAIGAVAIWFSHPSVFVLAGTGATLFVSAFRRGDRTRLRLLAAAAATWLASFAVCWKLALRATAQNPGLAAWWGPIFPATASDLLRLPDLFPAMLEYADGPSFRGLGLLAVLVAALALIASDREKLALLTAPFLFTLLATALHQYPFWERLVLFLFPFLLLLVADGAERVRQALRSSAPLAGAVWLGLLLFHPIRDAGRQLLHPPGREEIRPVLASIRERWRPGDRIYVATGAHNAFDFYAPRYGFTASEVIRSLEAKATWDAHRNDLRRLAGGGRTWVLFSHAVAGLGADEERLFLFFLDASGTRLETLRETGAAAHLYDMRGR